MHQQQATTQDYPNTCYQIGGTNNNQNPVNYPPPPPSYPNQMHQHGSTGVLNSAFQNTPGLFGYSRPPSPMSNPMYPHANVSKNDYYRYNLIAFL